MENHQTTFLSRRRYLNTAWHHQLRSVKSLVSPNMVNLQHHWKAYHKLKNFSWRSMPWKLMTRDLLLIVSRIGCANPNTTILDKMPWTSLRNYVKLVFLGNVLQLICYFFFRKSCQNFSFQLPVRYLPSFSSISEAFLKFSNELRS